MRRHAGYRISQIKRKRIEECFRLAKRQTAESASHRSISLPPEMWSARRLREVSALLEQFEFSGIIRRLSIE